MNTTNLQKPCVVQTPQGFSVSYNEHFLYSKYNPSKLILQTIQNYTPASGTIILCISPVLEYGLKELFSKLTDDCLLILCEKDNCLFDFSCANYSQAVRSLIESQKILYIKPENLNSLPVRIFNLANSGKYKRVHRIDFSAGCQLNKDYYQELETACINSLATFWKNRFTLTKFGRKYSHNIFKNLKNLSSSTPISNYFNSILKPIIVFGAGESVDIFFKNSKITNYSNYFIICADTALQPLLKRNINPDAVFIEEAQTVISKAFIGAFKNIHLFAGLSSLPSLTRFIKSKNISYFTTEFSKTSFLEKLYSKSFMPPVNPPFGSVGITAVYYAQKFRLNDSIPVYTVGLDFSFSNGATHAKNSMAHISKLTASNKLTSIENHGAFYSSSSVPFKDKSNRIFVTTPSLQGYAMLFNNLFYSTKNLYDSSLCGYPLNIQKKIPENSEATVMNQIKNISYTEEQKYELGSYISNEIEELKYLKDLLTGKIKLKDKELQNEITKIAAEKEYLYLHFPDGYTFKYNQSFLNRIRTEIDFCLKILES